MTSTPKILRTRPTARDAAGLLVALVMTGLALTVATADDDVSRSNAAHTSVVLAHNAGPASPPAGP